ncbi:MAG: hypothetical protein IPL78_36105 [Chloroflexi bacterium]|nr:hypothetical protein [Chloroflexota bacterium]
MPHQPGAGSLGHAVLAPLACQPELVSRGLLNTIFTNLVINANFAMLHCTGLLRGEAAPPAGPNSAQIYHGVAAGLAGYRAHFRQPDLCVAGQRGIELLGFPVGRTKLRADMVPHFPSYNLF